MKNDSPVKKTKVKLNFQRLQEFFFCLVLLALLSGTWMLLNGQELDPAKNPFVYKDF